MNKIIELKNKIKQYEDIAHDANVKIQNLQKEFLAITEAETQKYYHKYIKYYQTQYPGYVHYMFVEECDSNCWDDGWELHGHGFYTYTCEDGGVKFETILPSGPGLNLTNVDNGDDTVEFITFAEFYHEREKVLKQLMDERYSSYEP